MIELNVLIECVVLGFVFCLMIGNVDVGWVGLVWYELLVVFWMIVFFVNGMGLNLVICL